MQEPGTLIHCDGALSFLNSQEDPIIRNLLELAYTTFIRDRFGVRREGPAPESDFDMAYCLHVLKALFSDRDYVLHLLSGGEPERWFDDQIREAAGHALDTSAPLIPRADVATP